MGLNEIAADDFANFTSNTDEFGHEFVITAPDGTVIEGIKGYSTDISALIDPETGQMVAGRTASVSIAMRFFRNAGFGSIPTMEPKKNKKPWIFEWLAPNTSVYTFSVRDAIPDRKLDQTLFMLQSFKRVTV